MLLEWVGGLIWSHWALVNDEIINLWFWGLLVEVLRLLKIGAHGERRSLRLERSSHGSVHSLLRHEVGCVELAVRRAIEVNEEVLGDVFHIVVMDIIVV